MIFRYHSKKEMAPRGNNSFSTTYYKQHPHQITESKKMLADICEFVYEQMETDPEYAEFMTMPLKGFKRENKPNYTPDDIITDMMQQYLDNKDLCSGMLGRWNRLFKGSEYEIELEEEISVLFKPRSNLLEIFKFV